MKASWISDEDAKALGVDLDHEMDAAPGGRHPARAGSIPPSRRIAGFSLADPRDDIHRPAIRRLTALVPLDAAELGLIESMIVQNHRRAAVRAELLREGDPIPNPLLLLSGWAARTRILCDGRRQVLGLFLPGDLIGLGQQHPTHEFSAIVALTDVTLCPMPPRDELGPDSGLAAAYDLSRALNEHYLLAQIMRLGRLSAYERIADFLLEIRDRLDLAGLVRGDSFPLPLTQELIGDAMGLTSVHVNRTLQALRREGVLTIGNGVATLHQPEVLAEVAHHRVPGR